MIGASKPDTPVSPPITPHSLLQTFAGGTYAEINDPQLESIRQQAQMNHSEIRSTLSELILAALPHMISFSLRTTPTQSWRLMLKWIYAEEERVMSQEARADPIE